jgi:hypothetical protein
MKMKNLFAAALLCALAITSARAADVTPAEARAIAKEAYIYGSPMVDSYRVTYAYFVATGNPEYKGPFNQIRNFARLMTPADKAVQTPNSDTASSFLGLDLRAEPLVREADGGAIAFRTRPRKRLFISLVPFAPQPRNSRNWT